MNDDTVENPTVEQPTLRHPAAEQPTVENPAVPQSGTTVVAEASPLQGDPGPAPSGGRRPRRKRVWAGAAAALVAVSGLTGFGVGRATSTAEIAPVASTADPTQQGDLVGGGPGAPDGTPPDLPEGIAPGGPGPGTSSPDGSRPDGAGPSAAPPSDSGPV